MLPQYGKGLLIQKLDTDFFEDAQRRLVNGFDLVLAEDRHRRIGIAQAAEWLL